MILLEFAHIIPTSHIHYPLIAIIRHVLSTVGGYSSQLSQV